MAREFWQTRGRSARNQLPVVSCQIVGWELMVENEVQPTRYQCAGCGQWNETTVDPSGGRRQEYVEDCQVCCKPNLLRAEWDMEHGEWWVSAELE